MSGNPKRREATYEDLVSFPDEVVGQIVKGELYTAPRPAIGHQLSVSMPGGELVPPFQSGRGGPGGWRIVDAPALHIGPNVLLPDLAGWRRERLPALPREAFFTLAPDWVCEVLSPATARLDRLK
jgi:hypothetical protein